MCAKPKTMMIDGMPVLIENEKNILEVIILNKVYLKRKKCILLCLEVVDIEIHSQQN